MIKVVVITPRGTIADYECSFVLARGSDGDRGYLPSHSPVIMNIPDGYVRLDHDDTSTFVYINYGIMDLKNDVMSIVCQMAASGNTLEDAKNNLDKLVEHIRKENSRKMVDFVQAENELAKSIKKMQASKL